MLNIELPDDLAGPLAAEAERRGTTPELLALEGVRRMLPVGTPPRVPRPGSLLERLGDLVGSFEGNGEPNSQDCGKKFTQDLLDGKKARP